MPRIEPFRRSSRRVIAKQAFELIGDDEKMWVRVGAPEARGGRRDWGCRINFDNSWDIPGFGCGVSSLQALCLTLSTVSTYLYASPEDLVLDGDQSEGAIPAQWMFLDRAPYPFSLERFEITTRFACPSGESRNPRLIAQETYGLRQSRRRVRPRWDVRARIEAPRRTRDGCWSCAFSIDAPLNVRGRGGGASSLQALFAALAGLSHSLYGSAEYRGGRLGWRGMFSNSLLLPAVTEVLEHAPHPF